MKYLCIARIDLREGPDLEVGFYEAPDPRSAQEAVRRNFPESQLGIIRVYEVNPENCDVSDRTWD